MQGRKQAYKKAFIAVSSLAAIFILIEFIMQLFGKSICHTEGCKVVAQYVRYGDISTLLIGLVTFSLLAFLSFMNRTGKKAWIDPFINMILIASLASEGFFTGFQAFAVHMPCVLCLVVLGLMVILGVLRLLAGETVVVAGFLSLAAVFSMFYLVLPVASTANLPDNERFILFFSKDCKHCAEVIQNLEAKKIEVKHIEVNAYSAFLKSMGIDTVPTLMVNAQNQRLFISGKDAILRYLIACTPALETKESRGKPAKAGMSTDVFHQGSDTAIDIFNQPSLLTGPMSSDEDGMCKQGDVCK